MKIPSVFPVRVALLADFHLGFAYSQHSDDPRKEDSFRMAEEAMRIASEKADVIIVAGDIFDRPRLSTQIFLRALDIFDIPAKRGSAVRIVGGSKEVTHPPRGIPVVAVRGNHDVGADLHVHPVALLERAHRLIYLHANRIILSKESERVAITGVGWIPDKRPELVARFFAEKVPPPEPNAYNILVFHQPIKGIGIYPGEEQLPVSLLPPGYDVYVTGHLHWHVQKRVSDRWIVIPGSTIRTQLTDGEMKDDRAFWILDTRRNELEEVFLPSARRGFLYEVNIEGKGRDEVRERVEGKILEAIASNDRPVAPLVKIVLTGSTYDVFDLSPVVSKYKNRAIVRIFDRTSSNLAEKIGEIVREHESEEEIFSEDFALRVLENVMKSFGMAPGSDFRLFYEKLREVERVPTGPARERLLADIEAFLDGADVFLSVSTRDLEKSEDVGNKDDKKPVRRSGGTILDWA